jgi:hypothetical protein
MAGDDQVREWDAEFTSLGEEKIRDARRYYKGQLWKGPDGKIIRGKHEAAGRWLDKIAAKGERRNFRLAVTGIIIGVVSTLISIASLIISLVN